ncbi:MAG: hypothetical protein K2Q22_08270, partial [Cytophagales bacterium]|nr:hypothetical protein [Cytophagales bacterium]
NLLEQAKNEAAVIQRDAQMQAETMRADAERQARIRLEEADEAAKNAVFASQNQLNALIAEIRRLESYKENFILEVKNLASSVLEGVSKENAPVEKLEITLPQEVYIPKENTSPDIVYSPKQEPMAPAASASPASPAPKKAVTSQKVLTFFDQIQDV